MKWLWRYLDEKSPGLSGFAKLVDGRADAWTKATYVCAAFV